MDLKVKNLYSFLEDIEAEFGEAHITAEVDGREIDIVNVVFQTDIDCNGGVTIKMTEQPEN